MLFYNNTSFSIDIYDTIFIILMVLFFRYVNIKDEPSAFELSQVKAPTLDASANSSSEAEVASPSCIAVPTTKPSFPSKTTLYAIKGEALALDTSTATADKADLTSKAQVTVPDTSTPPITKSGLSTEAALEACEFEAPALEILAVTTDGTDLKSKLKIPALSSPAVIPAEHIIPYEAASDTANDETSTLFTSAAAESTTYFGVKLIKTIAKATTLSSPAVPATNLSFSIKSEATASNDFTISTDESNLSSKATLDATKSEAPALDPLAVLPAESIILCEAASDATKDKVPALTVSDSSAAFTEPNNPSGANLLATKVEVIALNSSEVGSIELVPILESNKAKQKYEDPFSNFPESRGYVPASTSDLGQAVLEVKAGTPTHSSRELCTAQSSSSSGSTLDISKAESSVFSFSAFDSPTHRFTFNALTPTPAATYADSFRTALSYNSSYFPVTTFSIKKTAFIATTSPSLSTVGNGTLSNTANSSQHVATCSSSTNAICNNTYFSNNSTKSSQQSSNTDLHSTKIFRNKYNSRISYTQGFGFDTKTIMPSNNTIKKHPFLHCGPLQKIKSIPHHNMLLKKNASHIVQSTEIPQNGSTESLTCIINSIEKPLSSAKPAKVLQQDSTAFSSTIDSMNNSSSFAKNDKSSQQDSNASPSSTMEIDKSSPADKRAEALKDGTSNSPSTKDSLDDSSTSAKCVKSSQVSEASSSSAAKRNYTLSSFKCSNASQEGILAPLFTTDSTNYLFSSTMRLKSLLKANTAALKSVMGGTINSLSSRKHVKASKYKNSRVSPYTVVIKNNLSSSLNHIIAPQQKNTTCLHSTTSSVKNYSYIIESLKASQKINTAASTLTADVAKNSISSVNCTKPSQMDNITFSSFVDGDANSKFPLFNPVQSFQQVTLPTMSTAVHTIAPGSSANIILHPTHVEPNVYTSPSSQAIAYSFLSNTILDPTYTEAHINNSSANNTVMPSFSSNFTLDPTQNKAYDHYSPASPTLNCTWTSETVFDSKNAGIESPNNSSTSILTGKLDTSSYIAKSSQYAVTPISPLSNAIYNNPSLSDKSDKAFCKNSNTTLRSTKAIGNKPKFCVNPAQNFQPDTKATPLYVAALKNSFASSIKSAQSSKHGKKPASLYISAIENRFSSSIKPVKIFQHENRTDSLYIVSLRNGLASSYKAAHSSTSKNKSALSSTTISTDGLSSSAKHSKFLHKDSTEASSHTAGISSDLSSSVKYNNYLQQDNKTCSLSTADSDNNLSTSLKRVRNSLQDNTVTSTSMTDSIDNLSYSVKRVRTSQKDNTSYTVESANKPSYSAKSAQASQQNNAAYLLSTTDSTDGPILSAKAAQYSQQFNIKTSSPTANSADNSSCINCSKYFQKDSTTSSTVESTKNSLSLDGCSQSSEQNNSTSSPLTSDSGNNLTSSLKRGRSSQQEHTTFLPSTVNYTNNLPLYIKRVKLIQ